MQAVMDRNRPSLVQALPAQRRQRRAARDGPQQAGRSFKHRMRDVPNSSMSW